MTLNELGDYINNLFRDRSDASQSRIGLGQLRDAFARVIEQVGGFVVVPEIFDTVARKGRTILGRGIADNTGALVQIEGYPSINGVLIDTSLLPGGATSTAVFNTATLDFNTVTNAGLYRIEGTSWSADGHNPASVFAGAVNYGLLMVSKNLEGFVAQQYFATDGTYYFRMSYPGSGFTAWQQPYWLTPGDFTTNGFLRTGKDNVAFKLTGVKAGAGLTIKTDQYLELITPNGQTYKIALLN